MESYVARTFDMDFVYLDLAFCAVWMLVLLRRRQTVALWFGLFGALVVFLVDDVLWLRVQHTRFLDVPLNRDLFLLYFSFTYGMIEFSYVTVMFGARSIRTAVLWTIFLYGGWMATALISQSVGLDDRTIDIGRDMSDSRMVQAALVAGGYLLLVVLKYTWGPMKSLTLMRMGYLFLVGVAVHFGMEITLLVVRHPPRPGLGRGAAVQQPAGVQHGDPHSVHSLDGASGQAGLPRRRGRSAFLYARSLKSYNR